VLRPFCFARLAKKQFDVGQSQNGPSDLMRAKGVIQALAYMAGSSIQFLLRYFSCQLSVAF
jgi:hypothetical protein